MNSYVTGAAIRQLREERKMTQLDLARQLSVSSKTVSKWETGKGLPDITLLEPLARALGISVPELMNGQLITNQNRCANPLRGKFYVCPLCGNAIHALGEAMISCCGITLPPLEAEEADAPHDVVIQPVENEHYLTFRHPMTKEHYISFVSFVTHRGVQTVKLYPEDAPGLRLQLRGRGTLYYHCNRHGLFQKKLP